MSTIKQRLSIGAAVTAAVAAAASFIARHEGLSTEAYPDPGYGWGIPTICYGHTRGVVRGQTATPGQCRVYLAEDIKEASRECLEKIVTVPVSKCEAAALVSFIENFGCAKAKNKQVIILLNKGDYAGAAAAFESKQNTLSNGKVMRGLVKRRREEREMFEGTSNDCIDAG